MNQQTCGTCDYFYQHYGLDSRRIFRVYCGHCTFSGVKRKRPDTQACQHFVHGPSDQEYFVTKEYLSKELLNYLFRLELLPEISDESPQQKRDTL